MRERPGASLRMFAATVFQWRYCIRLENLGEEAVQLRERHWRIFSAGAGHHCQGGHTGDSEGAGHHWQGETHWRQ